MPTRHKESAGPLSQNRYMSSLEFAELRGVNGVAVSARAGVVIGKRKQEFLWWLQGESLKEGGFRRLANALLEMFPERLGTPDMHKEGVKLGKVYSSELREKVDRVLWKRIRLHFDGEFLDDRAPATSGEDLLKFCRDAALKRFDQQKADYSPEWASRDGVQSLEDFLVDLCINPRIYFPVPQEAADFSSLEAERAMDKHPELSSDEFSHAKVPYFQDIIGALFEYKVRSEDIAKEKFYLTGIGKEIWETLDFALRSRRMVLLDGLEGRGKTEAVKAWCAAHGGLARFVSLKGITSKTTAFRQIAKALGIASSYTRNASEMQERAQDVLRLSKIMLVIDEAHYAFSQSNRVSSRPELIDWIDTALCNEGVPAALVTTPQFLICMTRAADKVGWNYRQFRRRVARWRQLPEFNTEEDIKGVARHVFPKANEHSIKQIAGYALITKRDLSAVGDIADEVRYMLNDDDLSKATPQQIERAIKEILLPGDAAFKAGIEAARKKIKAHSPAPVVHRAIEPQREQQPGAGAGRTEILPASAPAPRRGNITELVTG